MRSYRACNCLVTVGADREVLHGHAKFLLKELDILLECLGQLLLATQFGEVCLLTLELCIYRLNTFNVVWHIRECLAILLVCNASLDCGECVKNVALHKDEVGDTVDHNSVLESYKVNPSATALTACNGTVLMAAVAHQSTVGVKELCRERT